MDLNVSNPIDLFFIFYWCSCPPPGVPAGLRDIRHGGKDVGGQRPQPGEAAAGSPQGEPRGDPRSLPGGPETLHQRAGRGGPAVGAFRL